MIQCLSEQVAEMQESGRTDTMVDSDDNHVPMPAEVRSVIPIGVTRSADERASVVPDYDRTLCIVLGRRRPDVEREAVFVDWVPVHRDGILESAGGEQPGLLRRIFLWGKWAIRRGIQNLVP